MEEWKAAQEQAEVEGLDLPDELEPPEILEGLSGWLEDFWRLSTERQIGMGIGPIPASAIDRHTAGWSDEDAETFEFCIRELDGVYLMRANKTEDAPPEASSPMEAFRSASSHRRAS